jgi:hypothetical protein
MCHMLSLDKQERLAMGQRGREKMKHEFDEQIVIRRYVDAVKSLQP